MILQEMLMLIPLVGVQSLRSYQPKKGKFPGVDIRYIVNSRTNTVSINLKEVRREIKVTQFMHIMYTKSN